MAAAHANTDSTIEGIARPSESVSAARRLNVPAVSSAEATRSPEGANPGTPNTMRWHTHGSIDIPAARKMAPDTTSGAPASRVPNPAAEVTASSAVPLRPDAADMKAGGTNSSVISHPGTNPSPRIGGMLHPSMQADIVRNSDPCTIDPVRNRNTQKQADIAETSAIDSSNGSRSS